METHHKIALVTGGNRGIGFAIAQGLLSHNFDVIITSRTLAEAQQAAQKLSGKVIPLELDVRNDRSIEQAIQTLTVHNIDYLDVLINNAGVYPDNNVNIMTVGREVLETAMQINTYGVIRMVQACLPLLEKSQDGRIINLSSGMGKLDSLTTTAPGYCLSKLALNGATILLSQSLEPKGIAVNAMGPGWVKTDMGGDAAPRSPGQGADTAIWLATEAPSSETGKFWRDRKAVPF